jgi:hypothetical protein
MSHRMVLGFGVTYLDYGAFDSYDVNDQPVGSYSANAFAVSRARRSGAGLRSLNLHFTEESGAKTSSSGRETGRER